MRNQAMEYREGQAELLDFYSGAPSTLFESPPRAEPWAPELTAALRAYQSTLGVDPSFQGNEAVIITGQQPGVFTGPLYTIYKAVTALKLAQLVAERQGAPCAPVYWVGSEDHDFDEAKTAYFLTKKHESLALTYQPSADIDSKPMYRVPLEDTLHAQIDQAARETRGSEWREPVAAFLHESLDAADSLSDWTARVLARLFRDTSLVFFTPDLPEARKLSGPIIEREIRDPLATTGLLNDAGNRLDALGFPPQVMKGANECSFFLEMDERRRKLIFEDGQFVAPEIDRRFSKDELLNLLHENPECFSPNVALRCVVQQHLFPVAAYVAGPGELAYWGQLKPIFERYEKPMPIVWPRASAVLTTLKLNKIKRKLGMEIGELNGQFDALLDKALRNTATSDAFGICQTHRKEIEAGFANLGRALDAKDPTAATMARSLAQELSAKLDRLERSILQGDDAKQDATRKQVERLRNVFTPNKKPQERVFSVVSFLFEHGWDLIPRLLESLDIESFTMNEVEL